MKVVRKFISGRSNNKAIILAIHDEKLEKILNVTMIVINNPIKLQYKPISI
jgi:hypothetical protein